MSHLVVHSNYHRHRAEDGGAQSVYKPHVGWTNEAEIQKGKLTTMSASMPKTLENGPPDGQKNPDLHQHIDLSETYTAF